MRLIQFANFHDEHLPLSSLLVPQDTRNDSEPCEPIVDALYTGIFIWARYLHIREMGINEIGRYYCSIMLFFLYAFAISFIDAVEGTSSHE
jgi:hypothetical protein